MTFSLSLSGSFRCTRIHNTQAEDRRQGLTCSCSRNCNTPRNQVSSCEADGDNVRAEPHERARAHCVATRVRGVVLQEGIELRLHELPGWSKAAPSAAVGRLGAGSRAPLSPLAGTRAARALRSFWCQEACQEGSPIQAGGPPDRRAGGRMGALGRFGPAAPRLRWVALAAPPQREPPGSPHSHGPVFAQGR